MRQGVAGQGGAGEGRPVVWFWDVEMIRRVVGRGLRGAPLAAVAVALLVVGCEPSKPAPAPLARTSATPVGKTTYKPAESPTLKAVRARGYLACGVHAGLPGFALPDAQGQWRGFDVDLCRAVAAAVLGDATKVRFTVVDGADRFSALQRGELDILSRNTSETFARDAGLGLSFPVTTYFDGQGFLVPKALGLTDRKSVV